MYDYRTAHVAKMTTLWAFPKKTGNLSGVVGGELHPNIGLTRLPVYPSPPGVLMTVNIAPSKVRIDEARHHVQ